VRSVLRSDLTRHTPKATDIPPSLPTVYHTDNRNPKIDFTKDPTTIFSTKGGLLLEQKVLSVPLPTNDGFGDAVSIVSGSDGVYMLVGAAENDTGGSARGIAYLFHSTSAGILTQQNLTASDSANVDRLGGAVSVVSGSDGIFCLVGAASDDSGAGSAYLFHSKSSETFYIDSGGSTNQKWQTKITASDRAASDFFGGSVSLASGSDGIYAFVGAYADDDGGSAAGSAYLFHSKSDEPFYVDSGGSTNQKWQTKITASDGAAGRNFSYNANGQGVSVMSGTDGIYLLVGAYDGGTGPGAAYLFHSKSGEPFYVDSGGSTNQKWQTKLTASDGQNGDQFGYSVSLASGSDTVYMLVGADRCDVTFTNQGAAYLFHSKSDEPFYVDSGGSTNQKWQTKITASTDTNEDGEMLGGSVSVLYQPDGIYALVGAIEAAAFNGFAALFYSSSAGIKQQLFAAIDGQAGDAFGNSVAVSTGPNGIYVFAGANLAHSPLSDSGATYLFYGDIIKTPTLVYSQSYDNGFVNHAIPRSSLRYRWIQDSALTTEAQLPGYQHSSSVPFGPYDDIDYVLDSGNPSIPSDSIIVSYTEGPSRGDFIGISGTGVDKSGIAVQTPLGSDSTNFLSKSAGTIFNVYNGPYQYASWQQVRNGYNPIVIQLARESILASIFKEKRWSNKL